MKGIQISHYFLSAYNFRSTSQINLLIGCLPSIHWSIFHQIVRFSDKKQAHHPARKPDNMAVLNNIEMRFLLRSYFKFLCRGSIFDIIYKEMVVGSEDKKSVVRGLKTCVNAYTFK